MKCKPTQQQRQQTLVTSLSLFNEFGFEARLNIINKKYHYNVKICHECHWVGQQYMYMTCIQTCLTCVFLEHSSFFIIVICETVRQMTNKRMKLPPEAAAGQQRKKKKKTLDIYNEMSQCIIIIVIVIINIYLPLKSMINK